MGSGDASKVDFEPAVAKAAINACSTLIGSLLQVQSFLGSRNVESFAGPSGEFKSGETWAEAFRKLDTDLGGALNGHIAVVTALSEKFKNAIKEFKNAEDESITAFLNQKMPDKAPTTVTQGPDYSKINGKTPTPKPVETYKQQGKSKVRTHNYTDDAYNSFDLHGDRVVWPENPYVKNWTALRGLGESIHGVPGRLAADWGWMKDEINKAVTTFKTDTGNGHFRDSWQYGSGPTALTALDNARTALSGLTAKMGEVETSLYKIEGWLKATAERMPKGDEPKPTILKGGKNNTTQHVITDGNTTYGGATDHDCVEAMLSKYRQDCEAYYVAGIMEYNGSLISLPQPEKAEVPAPVITPAPTDQTPKTNPVGNPSGTPTVTQPTVTDPKTTDPKTTDPKTTDPKTTDPKSTTPTTDTTLTTLTSALTTLASTGASLVESLASQGSSLIQSLASSTQTAAKTTETTAQQLEQQLASLLNTPTTPADPSSPGGSPGGTPTGGSPGGTPKTETPKSTLFPRATVTATDENSETTTTSRAGLASGTTTSTGTSSGSGMAGTPMSGAGAAGQSGGKEHRRPDYLKSGENLDGVFQAAPEAVTPVAEK